MLFRIETDIPGYTIRIGAGSESLVVRGVTPLDIDLPEGRHLIQLVGWRDVPDRPTPRMEVKTSKFVIAAATPAEFRTAYRQEKANTAAEKAANWFDPMTMFMGVTEPAYGSMMSLEMQATQKANEPFTFVPFEEDVSFGSAFPWRGGGMGGGFTRPTAPPVEPSTDNSPVVLRWTVKDWVDKTEVKPVAPKVKATVLAVTKVMPAAISAAVDTAKTEGTVEAVKQNPLLAVAAGVGGTLGVLGLLKWLRGRSI